MLPARSMVEMNDLIAQAFRREHGRDSPLEVPAWWAKQVREVIQAFDPASPIHAGWYWARLSRRQQQDLLLEHVGFLPRLLSTSRGVTWLKRLLIAR